VSPADRIEALVGNARRLGHGAHTVAFAAALMPSLAGLEVRAECVWCADRTGTRGRRAFCLPKGGECQSCPETGADVLVTCAELGS